MRLMNRGTTILRRYGSMARAVGLCVLCGGCATQVVPGPDVMKTEGTVVIARVVTLLLDRPGRQYDPALRFFEIRERSAGERYRIQVESDDQLVILRLPAGGMN